MGNETEMLLKEPVALSSCLDVPIVPILVFSIIFIVVSSALCYRYRIFERCAKATVNRRRESEDVTVSREFSYFVLHFINVKSLTP